MSTLIVADYLATDSPTDTYDQATFECPNCCRPTYHEGEMTFSGGRITLKVHCFCGAGRNMELIIENADDGLRVSTVFKNKPN